MTALMAAATVNQDTKVISLLIENGADVNTIGEGGVTALVAALLNNPNFEVTSLLVENGADVNARIAGGNTVLTLTADDKYPIETMTLLIRNGADVNAKSDIGTTVLMFTAGVELDNLENNLDKVTLLLENGADANAKDNEGKTAIDYAKAIYAEDDEMITVLRQAMSVSGMAPAADPQNVDKPYGAMVKASAGAWATKIWNDLRNLRHAAMLFFIDNNKWPIQAEAPALYSPFMDRKLVGARQTLYKKVLISEEVKDWDGKMRAYIGVELFENQQGTSAPDIKELLAIKAEGYGIYDAVPVTGEKPSPYVDSDIVWMMRN
jgi:hypothetical protein